jgi:hypothetical protein
LGNAPTSLFLPEQLILPLSAILRPVNRLTEGVLKKQYLMKNTVVIAKSWLSRIINPQDNTL